MKNVEVPAYNEQLQNLHESVEALNNLWESYNQFEELDLDSNDARKRWLAFKPPE